MDNIYYGRGRDEDNRKLIAFINDVFFTDDPTEREFLELLPKIYKDKYRPAYCNFVAQEKDTGVFRSAVGNFYCDYVIGGEEIKACCIGNVAVGREYRGMGYMIKLMEMSVEDMKNNGADLAYLGGQRQRYGYFGFEQAGVCYNFGLSRSAYRHALGSIPSALTKEKLTEENAEAISVIAEIAEKNAVAAKRNKEDYLDILMSWRQVPYILKDGDKIIGYIVFNRDMDRLQEFGATDKAYYPRVIAAAYEIMDELGIRSGLHFDVGPFEKDKIDFFSANCDGIDMGGCEMILVYNFCKVIKAYLKAKASYCTLADGETTVLIHGKYGDENLTISVKDNCVSVEKTDKTPDAEMSHNEATRAFFSLHQNERFSMKPFAQQWLPLPMFQSSCDTM